MFEKETDVMIHVWKASIFWTCLSTLVVLVGCTSSAYRSLDPAGSSARGTTTHNTGSPVIQSRPASAAPASNARTASPASRPDQYQVRRGDTLYSIAFRFGLDFRRLAAANDIDRRYTIFPGQILMLREADAPVVAAAPSRPSTASPPAQPSANSRSSQTVTNATPAPSSPSSSSGNASNNNQLAWVWPHDGKIVRTFDSNVSDRKGVDLTGEIGDSVVAAAAGSVVYAGNGLPGYGNLIILEHQGSLLSAYAFNQELLVSEQDRVTAGQAIARMGRQGDQPSLHFEIRQEGKPVDPMRFLPRR
ncbi:peptidoglycan DD-metalloendopeptidase family protein [Saccharospirillum impatiens]|uniref:peptidoglycan DD-metalloendopeptidase family protein n=1 Tax=Saccharospirillum impatiens TaxID=169438 RepID=UPI0012FC2B33|nr:peptidoglycan DD-metalloendopeptidase family protein [Saccharospirillum impatiens]